MEHTLRLVLSFQVFASATRAKQKARRKASEARMTGEGRCAVCGESEGLQSVALSYNECE
jgi:hypothetical protein